jgi:hypothetical protein
MITLFRRRYGDLAGHRYRIPVGEKGDPVRMTVQGKEFATWIKVKGQWLYKARYVGLSEPPAA